MPRRQTKRVHGAELVKVADLKVHERNYREHPEDQVEHLAQSIREHGFYRNVVVARDGTILAGHGVVQAAVQDGLKEIPVVRLDLDPEDPKALKILTGDNELARLAAVDDRRLSEILKQIRDEDVDGLLGTGYDEQMLASLVYVTRPASEIERTDIAAEWVGMPEFEHGEQAREKLIIQFASREDRDRFVAELGLYVTASSGAWWPPRKPEDLSSVQFVEPE